MTILIKIVKIVRVYVSVVMLCIPFIIAGLATLFMDSDFWLLEIIGWPVFIASLLCLIIILIPIIILLWPEAYLKRLKRLSHLILPLI
jgi:hypothetical protein